MRRSVLIAAGGTGGHMFPALAVAAELRRRGAEVALVTDPRGARFAKGERGLTVITAAAPRGSGVDRVLASFALARGLLEGLAAVRRIGPGVAAAFGGYASVPAALAARLQRVPLLVHEQNAVMGRANRLLARLAAKLALSFERTRAVPEAAVNRVLLTGNPVRPGFGPPDATSSDPSGPVPHGRLRLLVLGGSQGARILSEVVPAAVALLPADLRRDLVIAQQCRPEDLEAARAAYAAIGQEVELATFFEDVPARMAVADLVLARAGASTIAELLTLAKPALLVPFAAAAEDHQTANARALAEAGAAVLLAQAEASPPALATQLIALLGDPDRRARMAAAAAGLARPDAAARIADALEELARGGISA